MSAAHEIAAARPSGASEAARFKRDTADRLVAYRSSQGLGCLGKLERLCGIPPPRCTVCASGRNIP